MNLRDRTLDAASRGLTAPAWRAERGTSRSELGNQVKAIK